MQEEAQQDSPVSVESVQDESRSLIGGQSESLAEGEWWLSDGVKGVGEKPDFYLSDRYKSLAEQAKAYPEIEKKFGSFTGAPKDGYKLPEGIEGDDELVKELEAFASETSMNQEGFEKALNLLMTQAKVSEEVSQEQELAKLGDKAPERIRNIENFLRNNIEPDEYDRVKDLITDAKSVELIETVINATAPKKLPIDGGEHPKGLTWADVEVEMFKKDEHGRLLRSVSPEHEAKVQRMMKDFG